VRPAVAGAVLATAWPAVGTPAAASGKRLALQVAGASAEVELLADYLRALVTPLGWTLSVGEQGNVGPAPWSLRPGVLVALTWAGGTLQNRGH
jgi:hypothetical protein